MESTYNVDISLDAYIYQVYDGRERTSPDSYNLIDVASIRSHPTVFKARE